MPRFPQQSGPWGRGNPGPPWAPAGRTKEPCKYVFPCTTLKQHTSPFHGEIILVKREESLYNGCGAVLLLCGRRFLLHRGVGCSRTSRPALIIRLDAILAHIPLECKRFFRTLHCSGPLFLLFRGWCIAYRRRGWPATDGAGAHIDGWEQGGVRGVFRSMQFPAVGLVVACRLVPVGIASLLRLRA